MKQRLAFAILVAMTLATTAGATEAKPKKQALVDSVSGAGYGTAGCGLGSILFGAKPGKIQIFSSSTNGLYGNNTFGISSGTSNCDIPKMGQQAAVYIEVNKEIVKKDAARGQGDTLIGLSHIFNCSNDSLFSSKMQQNYGTIFGEDNSTYGNTRAILNTIKNDRELAATCKIQG